ncbi:hypothetical protein, partial [Oceanivirga salmonicida]|uniref:hypothetical protein n=1 Tax=Oceanivirga salmonicida TaxID=1769291 RepID=UPI0018D236AE
KNIEKSLKKSVEVGGRVRYDIITQKVSGDARLSYERQKYLGVTYDDNELKAKKLNIKVKKVEKEENKGIEEKDISGFSILAGSNGASLNVKKNDIELGVNIDYNVGKEKTQDGKVIKTKQFLGGGGSFYHKGNGIGLGFHENGEIKSSNLRVHGVDYNLHLDLAMPSGALKFADDLKNVI